MQEYGQQRFSTFIWFDLAYRSCDLPTRAYFKVSYKGDGFSSPTNSFHKLRWHNIVSAIQ